MHALMLPTNTEKGGSTDVVMSRDDESTLGNTECGIQIKILMWSYSVGSPIHGLLHTT